MGFSEVFLLFIATFAFSLYQLTHADLEFHLVSPEIASQSLYLSSFSMFLIRLAMGFIVWISSLSIYFDTKGLNLTVQSPSGSPVIVTLKQFERFTPFTVWCWLLQGIYFASILIISIPSVFNIPLNQSQNSYIDFLVKVSWITFEISVPMSFLVSSVVTFVLIPLVLSQKLPVDAFFSFIPLLFHNANILFMVVEILLNRIPFLPSHWPFAVLWGLAYVAFSWWWFKQKGVFYYFFLDYSKPLAFFWQLCLLAIVSLYFFLGFLASSLRLSPTYSSSMWVVLPVLTIMCMKFRR